MNGHWQTILAIDFDRWAAQTYRANFPETRVEFGPVWDYIDKLPDADVILGGPPCQPHSHAGKRGASKDARDCGPDFVAAVAKVKPRMFLMENVDGLLTSENGRYFQRMYAAMDGAGYVVQYRVQDAVDFSVPQFRSRLWVWGIRRDLYVDGIRHCWPVHTHAWPPPETSVLFGVPLLPGVTVGEALGLDGIIHRRRGQGMCERHGERRDTPTSEPSPLINAGVARQFHLIQSHADPARTVHMPAPALRSGGDGHDGCCLRIMGGGRNNAKGADGEWVRHERDITNQPSTTLAGTHIGTHHGAQNPRVVYDHGVCYADEPSVTIKAGGNYDASGKQGGGCPPVVAWRWSEEWKQKHPPIELGMPSPSIIRNWHKGMPYGAVKVKQNADGLWVRRLHVLECARLQSLPDDFIFPENLPITHAYKVIGNGWATAHAAHFSRALAKADPDSRTVVDLFCGGGLGACGWHQRFWSYVPREVGVA